MGLRSQFLAERAPAESLPERHQRGSKMTKVVQLETPKAPEIVSDLEPVLRLDGSLEEVELETRRRRNGPRSEVRMRATRRRVCCRWELIGAVLLVWASLSWLLVECQRTASKGGASVSSSSTVGPHKETDQSGAGASGTASKARGTQSLGAGTKVGPVCQYEKGRWAECTADGFQLKVQKLKTSAGENGPNSAACQPSKTIRRDCKPVGCKYERGEWSNKCDEGKRVRVDRLVGALDSAGPTCKPLRKVTKECGRTCHYAKSAWGECANGVQTRNLTLAQLDEGDSGDQLGETVSGNKDNRLAEAPTNSLGAAHKVGATKRSSSATKKEQRESGQAKLVASVAPVGQSCAKFKLMKRDCPKLGGGSSMQNSANSAAAQRRRLKQMQKSRQKQRQMGGSTELGEQNGKRSPGQTTSLAPLDGTSSLDGPPKRPQRNR